MDLNNGLSYYMVSQPVQHAAGARGGDPSEEGEALTAETAKVAIQQLRRYFDYVVVDTGCSFTNPVLAALENADRVVVVCSPEIPVLRDIRDCQRIFNDVLHITRDRILYVMNYTFPFRNLSKEQFEQALEQPMYMEFPYEGDVPSGPPLEERPSWRRRTPGRRSARLSRDSLLNWSRRSPGPRPIPIRARSEVSSGSVPALPAHHDPPDTSVLFNLLCCPRSPAPRPCRRAPVFRASCPAPPGRPRWAGPPRSPVLSAGPLAGTRAL